MSGCALFSLGLLRLKTDYLRIVAKIMNSVGWVGALTQIYTSLSDTCALALSPVTAFLALLGSLARLTTLDSMHPEYPMQRTSTLIWCGTPVGLVSDSNFACVFREIDEIVCAAGAC